MGHRRTHAEFVRAWAAQRDFDPVEIDCATAVMLKILDGKCKMSEAGKRTMALLYDCVKSLPGSALGEAEHAMIADALAAASADGVNNGHNDGEDDGVNDEVRMRIYERRVLAEVVISRSVMKSFKAMLRAEGVIGEGVAV